jgi:hypothetical protein
MRKQKKGRERNALQTQKERKKEREREEKKRNIYTKSTSVFREFLSRDF